MSFTLAESVRTARLQQIANAIDAAVAPGKLVLYPGSQPASGAATAEVAQCVIVLAQPCASVVAAAMTFEDGMEGARTDVQEITWGRFVDGDDEFVADADVSGTGDGGTIIISNVNGLLGGIVRLESGVIGE